MPASWSADSRPVYVEELRLVTAIYIEGSKHSRSKNEDRVATRLGIRPAGHISRLANMKIHKNS